MASIGTVFRDIPDEWVERYVTEKHIQPSEAAIKRIMRNEEVDRAEAYGLYFRTELDSETRSKLFNAWRQHKHRQRQAEKLKQADALRNESQVEVGQPGSQEWLLTKTILEVVTDALGEDQRAAIAAEAASRLEARGFKVHWGGDDDVDRPLRNGKES